MRKSEAKQDERKKIRMYSLTIVFSLLCLLLVSLFWREPSLLTALLIANAAFLIWIGKPRHDIVLFAFAGIWGAAAEMFAVQFGSWYYPIPSLFGIPYWLPFVWGTAGVFLVRLSHAISELGQKFR